MRGAEKRFKEKVDEIEREQASYVNVVDKLEERKRERRMGTDERTQLNSAIGRRTQVEEEPATLGAAAPWRDICGGGFDEWDRLKEAVAMVKRERDRAAEKLIVLEGEFADIEIAKICEAHGTISRLRGAERGVMRAIWQSTKLAFC
jgi:hypothetical protein